MGKYDVDFDDYEEKAGGNDYSGEEPIKGTYDGVLVAFKEHVTGEGNESLRWVFQITEEPYAGWQGYLYSDLENSKWKTQQIVKAIQGGKEDKMSLKPAGADASWEDQQASPTVKKAKPVRLRMRKEMYEGEPRGRIARVLPNENAPEKKKKKKGDDPSF